MHADFRQESIGVAVWTGGPLDIASMIQNEHLAYKIYICDGNVPPTFVKLNRVI